MKIPSALLAALAIILMIGALASPVPTGATTAYISSSGWSHTGGLSGRDGKAGSHTRTGNTVIINCSSASSLCWEISGQTLWVHDRVSSGGGTMQIADTVYGTQVSGPYNMQ